MTSNMTITGADSYPTVGPGFQPRTYQLPYGDVFKTKNSTERNWRTANDNLVLLSEAGSTMHGISVGGDDLDLQGVCIEPPEVMLGTQQFDLYDYRSQPVGHRSGEGDIDLQVYCHSPESKVLTAELEWREIASLQVGDKIISFDEADNTPQRHRHFSTGMITAMQLRAMPRYRVITSQGDSVVSGEHAFLTRHTDKPRTRWTQTLDLKPGQLIYSLPTWIQDRSWAGGYLAGQYDGEAHLTIVSTSAHSGVSQLTWTQLATSPEVPYLESLLAERGYKTSRQTHGTCTNVSIGRDWFERARFLGSIRPRRLLRHPQLSDLWEKRSLQVCGRATVLAVEPVGLGEVVAMEVDTHTYIADGLLTHNSLSKWVRLICAGNPTHLMPLFAPEHKLLALDWPGVELRNNIHLFLARSHGQRFLGYLNSQRSKMLGERKDTPNRPELIEKYGWDTKFGSHALRIAIQGAELLRTGRITLPMAEHHRRYLIDVRRGKYTQSEVLAKLGRLESDLAAATEYSVALPEQVDFDYVNDWLVRMYAKWWVEKGLLR